MTAEVSFRQLFCRAVGCGLMFFVCRPCYRGQVYCDDECRRRSRREQRRQANLRYQQDPEVREDQCRRMREYRERKREGEGELESRVIDQSSVIECGLGTIGEPLVKSEPEPPTGEKPDEPPKPSWPERLRGVFCIICGRMGRFVAARNRRE
jgi:hypothetical protein